MIARINYLFELNGGEYQAFNRDCGDFEEAKDIQFLSATECKQSAICIALGLTIDELTDELINNANFKYLSINCDDIDRDVI